MVQNHFHITIVGGGMVGMSLALMLARQNAQVSIALIDAQTFPDANQDAFFQPSFDARSTAVARGSMEIFERLGIWSQLQTQATPIEQIHVSDSGHFMGGLIDAQEYAVDALGYVIPNEWIGRVLLQQIRSQANIQLMPDTRVEKIIHKIQGAELIVNSSGELQHLRSHLVVLADGGPSKLAQQLGIDFSVDDYQQSAIIANVEFSKPHQLIAYERFTPSGPIALLPLGKTASSREAALVFTLPREIAQSILDADEKTFLQQVQNRFGQRLGQFTACSRRHLFDLKLVTASEQIRSGLVLLGNAAHFLHPVAGQGFNLSLRDCQALVQTLNRYSPESWGQLSQLQEYLALQANDQQKTIFFSDQLVKLFSSSRLPAIALRHLGFMGLEALPSLKNILVNRTMGKTA